MRTTLNRLNKKYGPAALCFGAGAMSLWAGTGRWAWMAVPFLICGVLIVLAARPKRTPATTPELTIDDTGLLLIFGRELHGKTSQFIAWNQVQRIVIETTDGGPWQEDFFVVIVGSPGDVIVVDNAIACQIGLIDELQRRFPALDNQAIVDAAGCTRNRTFPLWKRSGDEPSINGESPGAASRGVRVRTSAHPTSVLTRRGISPVR